MELPLPALVTFAIYLIATLAFGFVVYRIHARDFAHRRQKEGGTRIDGQAGPLRRGMEADDSQMPEPGRQGEDAKTAAGDGD